MTQAPLIWHALRTEPQREFDVARALERFGIYARVKTESRLRKWTKWDKVRTYRTFVAAPGYCFIGMPIGVPVPWYKILRIHMIYSIVGLHGDPARFDHDEMVRFLGHEGKRLPGYFRHFRTGHEYKIGDEVIVTRGVLADHKLRVQDVQDGEAHFIMRLLGRDQLVKIPVDDCVRAA